MAADALVDELEITRYIMNRNPIFTIYINVIPRAVTETLPYEIRARTNSSRTVLSTVSTTSDRKQIPPGALGQGLVGI